MLFGGSYILFLLVVKLKEINDVGKEGKLKEDQSLMPWGNDATSICAFLMLTGATPSA